MQSLKYYVKASLVSLTILCGTAAAAQTTDALNSFTPYSIFGVGSIAKQGTSLNKSMGGIGIGLRDNRYINYLNPASISFRDTLAFMLDFGIESNNNYYASAEASSAYNAFNMHHFVMSFPVYKKSAIVVGVTPYTSVGYKFQKVEDDPEIINELGDVTYRRYGVGGINKIFLGGSAVFLKNFSVGAELIYFFGTIDRYSNINFSNSASYRSINTGQDLVIRSMAGKFGLQYSYSPDKQTSLTLGATYMLKSTLGGERTDYAYSTSSVATIDTVFFNKSNTTGLEIPSELGFGASFRKQDKWMLGIDFTSQNWTNASVLPSPGTGFTPGRSYAVKVGGEFTPNRYDVRYYLKRATYRAGFYYDRSFVNINGKQVNSVGITIGTSLPVYRWYNAFGISLDMGQRGALRDGLVRERYVMLNLNVSLHDIWFQKYRYD
ncbi:MAG: hypothetical protein CVT93_09565 [Bacteroidetes bacterium HGW-Bacteroidetes-10]|jgi:hypothetical protein|nr:MAG: hypothetical protein CVT93_09565 [Bacteroidetes bacterium HGW-Bacteroidetes-10]